MLTRLNNRHVTHTDLPQPEFSRGYDPEAPRLSDSSKCWRNFGQVVSSRNVIDLTRLGSLSASGGGERRRFRGLRPLPSARYGR